MLVNIKNIHEGTRYRIKDREKSEIYHYIYQHSGVTRKEIANITNIRPSTVSGIASELLDHKLIYEGRNKNPGEKGRPELFLYPDYNRYQCIALYVSSQSMKGVLINMQGKILAEDSARVPLDIENEEMLTLLKNLILSLAAKASAGTALLGAGISMLGVMNRQSGELLHSSRWNKLKKLSFNKLEELTGIKCRMHNALDAELEYLLIENPLYRKGGTVLYHWGYGIGASYSHNGNILHSTLGSFLEAGHLSVCGSGGKHCRCGQQGCLETEAALWAILPELKKDYNNLPEDESEFHDFIVKSTILQSVAIKNALKYITDNLLTIHSLFFPDRILLTGPFFSDKRILKKISSKFAEGIPSYASDHVSFDVLNSSFTGEVFGSTYEFFFNTLKKELICR